MISNFSVFLYNNLIHNSAKGISPKNFTITQIQETKEEHEFETYVLFIYIKINMILMYKIHNVIIILEREKINKGNWYSLLCLLNINDKIFLEFFMLKHLRASRKADVIK